jgi:hypothetical protein
MARRSAYFSAAALGAVASLVLLMLNQGEDVTTPVALSAAWTAIMLVLALRQSA